MLITDDAVSCDFNFDQLRTIIFETRENAMRTFDTRPDGSRENNVFEKHAIYRLFQFDQSRGMNEWTGLEEVARRDRGGTVCARG